MSDARELPRRIVIGGDGLVAIIAAIALRRALPSCDITVIGTPFDSGAVADHAASALPFTNRFHDQLGISEDALIRRCGGSHRLVTRYFDFGGPGHIGVAPYGGPADPALKSAFARDWGGGPRNAATGRSAFSIAEALADTRRFATPSGEQGNPLAELDYAMRWNNQAYRELLIEVASGAGVQYRPGKIDHVVPDGQGGAAAVVVSGVGDVPADLFIDCTGPGAAILSRLPGAERNDWKDTLPVRGLIHLEFGEPMVELEDRVAMTQAGWVMQTAGRDGQAILLGVPDGMREETILSVLGKIPYAAFRLDPGRARNAWVGNVIALGDAAATFEPLGWLNLDLAHRQIALLLELLPGRTPDPAERTEYNRRAGLMADRARDWVAAHYSAPGALGLFGHNQPSSELALALDQFRRRGRVPFFEEMPMLAQEWATVLHALGMASAESAVSRVGDPREAEQARQVHEARCRAAVQVAPPYGDWLGTVLQP